MAARGILGQSVASQALHVSLFGGFDDHFAMVDGLTGRVRRFPAPGRVILYPWDESHFLAVEEALGRPSRTRLTWRRLDQPDRVEDVEWEEIPVLVPGLYPTVFEVGEAGVLDVERPVAAAEGARVEFAPGIFHAEVPVLVDGAWQSPRGMTLAGPAVGRGDRLYVATESGLVIDGSAELNGTAAPQPWRPAVIEHDPIQQQVAVVSWNRWGRLGGPSSDVYVFEDRTGGLVATARFKSLLTRVAISGDGLTGVDVEDNFTSAPLHSATV